MKIFIPWITAFAVLFFYYSYIQLPMEKSFVKGLNYLSRDMNDEAINEFNKVIRIYPHYVPAYLDLSQAYFDKGNWDEMIRHTRMAVGYSIMSGEDMSERSVVYHNKEIYYGTVAKSRLVGIDQIKGTILDPLNPNGIWEDVSSRRVRLKPQVDLKSNYIFKIAGNSVNKIGPILQQAHNNEIRYYNKMILNHYLLSMLHFNEKSKQ